MSFKKSDTQRIVVARTEFRGQDLVDVRVQVKRDDEWIFTKMGLQLPAAMYEDFLDFLDKTGVPKKQKAVEKKEPIKETKKSERPSRSAKPDKEKSRTRDSSREQARKQSKEEGRKPQETVKKKRSTRKIDASEFLRGS